jgi:hypothetical protein
MNIGLVSCGKRKLARPCPARELYSASALFRKARAYCERHYDSWYILRAKHGLVCPDEVLAPYDLTLKGMPVADRRAWGRRVSADLRALGDRVFHAHAGKDYLEYVSGVKLVNVLEGLRQGERLRWYNEQAAKQGWECP